ncbi:MAG: gephyrin-like molybdotransferase Glp [Coriobacteriales bacterium]
MPNLIAVEDAQNLVLEFTTLMPVETVAMLDAPGRVVAADLTSDVDINGFADAAMDGFALKAADIAEASDGNPIELKIVDVVGAGAVYDGELQHGEAVRIMTGAAMPAGSDVNVKIEDVQVTGEGVTGDTVLFTIPAKEGANVRQPGEEAKAGELVLAKGTLVNAAAVGVLASTGNVEVPVYGRPKVGVISIGTELVDSSTVPGFGMKRDSNRHTLAAMARNAGAEVILYPIVPDVPEKIEAAYREAIAQCDYVVSSGGACGGDFDYITQIITSLADIKFEYVNMKPGKAQTFGVTPDGKLLFGLSGNPAASATGFEILVRPSLLKAQGHTALFRPMVKAVLEGNAKTKGPRRHLLRGCLKSDGNGGYVASPLAKQSSALIGATSQSNCFIVIPEGSVKAESGMEVTCIRIDMPEGAEV